MKLFKLTCDKCGKVYRFQDDSLRGEILRSDAPRALAEIDFRVILEGRKVQIEPTPSKKW